MRDSWTDPRLDDLNHRVDSGFNETSREFQALRLEMQTEFAAVRSEMQTEFVAVRSEMQAEFASVRSEMAAMNRTMLQIVVGGFGVMLVGFAGTIATVISQG